MHTPFMDKQSPHHRRDTTGSRLKHRLAQILTRSSCTTNTTSTTANSGTAFVSLARAADSPYQEAPPSPYFCTPCTYERPTTKVVDGAVIPHRHRRRRTRSASLVHISFDCTGGGASGRRSVQSDAPLLHHLSVPARDVVINKQSKGKPAARRSPSASRRHLSSLSSSSWGRARRPTRRSTIAAPYSWSSSSSTATDDEVAPFSSDEGEGDDGEETETRTLLSSLSFSSDSSELYRRNNTRNTSHRRRTTATARRALPRTAGTKPGAAADGAFRPVVVSAETARKQHRECSERKKEEKGLNAKTKPMGAAAAEEAGAGMAVVKRSSNPYLDFRSSMVEMVVERRIASVGQMEELLGSYLSLNSPRHHPAILAAFEDVWEAVFGEE